MLTLGAAALLISAAPASAATSSLKITDPVNDQKGPTTLDITGATIAQNTSTGAVTATVAFAAAPAPGSTFAVALGSSENDCDINDASESAAALVGAIDAEGKPQAVLIASSGGAPAALSPSLSGKSLKITTPSSSALKKLKWDCARVSIQMQGATAEELLGDDAVANGPSLAAQVVVLTDKPDGDKDGVPDVADACPTVPGSTANGCLAVAAKKAFRLGAKRLVVDRMVLKTGDTCRATAKATVKDGKKTIGKGSLKVGVHGSYCHINGIVKIKKHGKKVKLSIKGGGFKALSANVKK
ncbi:MAG: hypothetical protein J7513_03450 [Solirubrobacteraceae bacterium]|nr:hypothetical protein [Solirubrobacteraceae bacterium]